MLRHLLIRFVDNGLAVAAFDDAGLEIVRREDPGDAAKETVSIDVCRDPGILLHIQKCFDICISAVRQHRHKQVRIQQLAGGGIQHMSRGASPVYLHGLAGLVIQVHRGLGFVDVLRVVLVELRGLVRKLAGCPALLAVLDPQQAQRDTAFLHFPMHALVVRHLILLADCRARIQPLGHFCFAQSLYGAPRQPKGFCSLERGNDCTSCTAARFRDPGVVDPKAMQPQDLFVIGHI